MGRAEWILSMKQSFLSEWLACPPREARQIQEKIDLLLKDPRPDAKVKKQLKYLSKDKQTKLYRIRCGVYRLFYTFKGPYVSLLAIRRREEDTYDEDLDPQLLGGLSVETGGSVGGQEKPRSSPTAPADESPRTPLPGKITTDLLRSLRISDEHDSALLDIEDEETLFACPWLDDGQLLRLHEALIERPIEEVLNQKEFVAASTADLIRFKEGDLLGFLLKLDPEQERFVYLDRRRDRPDACERGPRHGEDDGRPAQSRVRGGGTSTWWDRTPQDSVHHVHECPRGFLPPTS